MLSYRSTFALGARYIVLQQLLEDFGFCCPFDPHIQRTCGTKSLIKKRLISSSVFSRLSWITKSLKRSLHGRPQPSMTMTWWQKMRFIVPPVSYRTKQNTTFFTRRRFWQVRETIKCLFNCLSACLSVSVCLSVFACLSVFISFFFCILFFLHTIFLHTFFCIYIYIKPI